MNENKFSIGKTDSKQITEKLFAMSEEIRYVAVYCNGKLDSTAKPNLEGASSSESDKYEEIIVNPTLLTLLRQRGEIDCGGVEYVIIRYGNFIQTVHPLPGGHISIAFQPDSNYGRFLPEIRKLVTAELY